MTQPKSKPPRSNELEKEARKWIAANRPEPPRCDYCGHMMPTVVMASVDAQCFKSPDGGHRYTFTTNTDYESLEAKRLAAFAAQVEERAVERCYDIAHGTCEGHELWDRACMKIAGAIKRSSRGQ